jgi:RNA polymerase sigma factor (sigma-70 family)
MCGRSVPEEGTKRCAPCGERSRLGKAARKAAAKAKVDAPLEPVESLLAASAAATPDVPAPVLPAAPLEPPLSGLRSRLPALQGTPLAKPDEVLELVAKAKAGDLRARDEVIRANMGYVATIARRRAKATGEDLEDLVQDGVLGIMKAIELFDGRPGIKFLTYASWRILHAVGRGSDERQATLAGMTHIAQFRRRQREHAQLVKNGMAYDDALELVAKNAEIPVQSLRERFEALHAIRMSSLDAPVRPGDDPTTFVDMMPSDLPRAENVIDELRRDDYVRSVVASVRRGLKPREIAVLDRRVFPADGESCTLDELAKEFDLSRERIRQIDVKVRAMLRAALAKGPTSKGARLRR